MRTGIRGGNTVQRIRARGRLLGGLLLAALWAPAVPAAEAPTLQDRLDRLTEGLEAQREELHVPGLAIAVVLDDQVVFARGFGVTDLESRTPVTPETLFAVGSTTKAFTTTLIGMLVDEGKMAWDDPVTKYLPAFALQPDTEEADARITLRDMLAHRTGFTRMGALWAGGAVPARQILRVAATAEPWAPFREQFNYNNVMYLAAGMASGEAAGTSWDALVKKRLLQPLGMTSTTTSVRRVRRDARLATGYMWDEGKETHERLPMRNLDVVAPAGAINSNVLDMARWVRFQLGRGAFEGRRLISETQLQETWTSQIEVTDGIEYGLGWMLHEWNGKPVVEHGGNIDGFMAQVGLLPEENLGFVLLGNVTASAMQALSLELVWEAMAGDWSAGATAGEAAAAGGYEPYLGRYVANFGPFADERFTVQEQNGNLAVDVPGQMVYELKSPDDEGKWYFAITNPIAVTFEKDDAGAVVLMRMHQGGLDFELPREGIEITGEIPVEELERYLGKYHSQEAGLTGEVVIQNNRLAVDVPGQMVFELHPPDDEGKWIFRVTDEIAIRFNETEGAVTSLTFFQDGKEMELARERGAEEQTLPSVEDLLALRKTEARKVALAGLGVFRLSGTVRLAQSGIEGKTSILCGGGDRYRTDVDLGRFGASHTVVNGDQAWVDSTFNPFFEAEGKFLDQARKGNPLALVGDWRDFYGATKVLRVKEVDEGKVYVVKLSGGEAPPATVEIDAKTGDLVTARTTILIPGIGGLPQVTHFADFREVEGVRIPFRMVARNEASGKTEIQFDRLQSRLRVSDRTFRLKPPRSR